MFFNEATRYIVPGGIFFVHPPYYQRNTGYIVPMGENYTKHPSPCVGCGVDSSTMLLFLPGTILQLFRIIFLVFVYIGYFVPIF